MESGTSFKIGGVASIWQARSGIRRLLRHFPYTEMLAIFLPIYAYLWTQGQINSLWALVMMCPFVFADAAGFIFNNLQDIEDPHFKENPIVRGEITPDQAKIVLFLCLTISCVSFLVLYSNIASYLVYFPYLFLCLGYSGLGVRFKETSVGPLVASFIVWVGGALILVTEFMAFDGFTVTLLVGSWLVYIGRELRHMITDHRNDLSSGYRTAVVRGGIQAAAVLETSTFVIGSVVLMASAYFFAGAPAGNWIVPLSIFVLCTAILLQVACRLTGPTADSKLAYLLIRVFYVLCAGVVLRLAPFVAILLLWSFLTSKRS